MHQVLIEQTICVQNHESNYRWVEDVFAKKAEK